MKRGARDSQIINNYFTLVSILIISGTLAVYSKYFSEDENAIYKPPKIECEYESYTKSKTFNQKLLDKSVNAIDKGYYKLDGGFIENEEMKSSIKDLITLEQTDKFYKDAIKIEAKNNLQKFVKIKYEIIENSKSTKDKNKRLSAGSVQTSFRINSNEFFRVTTDFNFMYKNAIKERIDCSIKVFRNHVQSSK